MRPTVAAVAILGFSAAVCAPTVQAQTTTSLSSLFLSPNAEIDLGLYGGGVANGSGPSDRIVVQNQFNYSSASPASYTFAFTHGDTVPLTAGTTYTLMTFGTTNFAPTDASAFHAAPRGTLSALDGVFSFVPADTPNGLPGKLQFLVTSAADTPEPGTGLLVALSLPVFGIWRWFRGAGLSADRSSARNKPQ